MLLQMVRGGAMKGGPAHGRTREHRQHCGGRAQAAARRTRGSNHGCIPRRTRKRICPPSRYGFTANTWLILSMEKKFFFWCTCVSALQSRATVVRGSFVVNFFCISASARHSPVPSC